MKSLTIISPVYNEEGNINLFYSKLKDVLDGLKYRSDIIFVNDGSTDDSTNLLSDICKKDKNVKIVNFARNFGHQAAITAGLDYSKGDIVIIIDSDLQDPPEVIKDLVKMYEEGYEIVNAKRRSRKDSFLKKLTAKLFYRILNLLITSKIPEDVGDFRLIDRKAVNVLISLPEKDRYLRGLSTWVGFKQGFVLFDRNDRYSGKTHYSMRKMFGLAFDAIFSFSKLPMKLALISAMLFMLLSIIVLIYAIYSWLSHTVVAGWASTLFIFSIFTSLQMFVMAIISEYVGRIYTQTQNRPIYVVRDTNNI